MTLTWGGMENSPTTGQCEGKLLELGEQATLGSGRVSGQVAPEGGGDTCLLSRGAWLEGSLESYSLLSYPFLPGLAEGTGSQHRLWHSPCQG